MTDTRPIYWTVSDFYVSYYNRDFGSIRGFEAVLIRRRPGLITGEMSYTYSIAKGKSSIVGQGYTTEWSGNIVPTFESYLDWDQTHMFVANLSLNLGNLVTSFVADYGSGTRYTRPEQGRLIIENTERYPSVLNSHLRMTYTFKVGQVNSSAYILVTNLFDRRNLLRAGHSLPSRTSRLSDVQWYHTYKTLADKYEAGEIDLNTYMTQVDLNHDGKVDQNKLYPERGAYLNPAVYADVRRIKMGLYFSF